MEKLILIISLMLAGCASVQPPVKGLPAHYNNACMPEAIAMCEGLTDKGIDAQVLVLTGPGWSHALCRYEYPIGESRKYFLWDSYWGSLEFTGDAWDAQSCTDMWMKWRATGENVSGTWLE